MIDDQTVSVTISVTRADPSRPVDCIVRVRSKDGSETGRREVLVAPSDQATVQVTTVLKSSRPPRGRCLRLRHRRARLPARTLTI